MAVACARYEQLKSLLCRAVLLSAGRLLLSSARLYVSWLWYYIYMYRFVGVMCVLCDLCANGGRIDMNGVCDLSYFKSNHIVCCV